jgi:hypothetical protein
VRPLDEFLFIFEEGRRRRTMRQSCIRTFCFSGLLVLMAAGTAFPQKSSPVKIPNGFYAVLSEESSREKARSDSIPNIVLVYDGKYVDSSQTASPSYVALDTVSFVPLILEDSPTTKKDGNGRTLLGVALSKQYVRTLEDFTKAHLGGR